MTRYSTADQYHWTVRYGIDVLHARMFLFLPLDSHAYGTQQLFVRRASSHQVPQGYFLRIEEANLCVYKLSSCTSRSEVKVHAP